MVERNPVLLDQLDERADDERVQLRAGDALQLRERFLGAYRVAIRLAWL